MYNPEPQWTPKIHPATRPVEIEDPMMLVATAACGDPRLMLECLIREFIAIGYEVDDLYQMFKHPNYPVLNQYLDWMTEQELYTLLNDVARECGVLRVTAVIAEDDIVAHEEDVDLVQIHFEKRIP